MSQKKTGQLKNSKLFTKWDLLFYGLLLVVILLLLVFFVFDSGEQGLLGIEIICDNQTAFIYYFLDDTYSVESLFTERVEVTEFDDGLTVTIYDGTEKENFNTIVIEKAGRIFVQDANCSYHKDCTKMSPITDSEGIIICLPHNIVILPLNGIPNPSTG